MQRILSPGLVVATLALVVASSTAGYAGAKVTSRDIKDNTISSADIKDGAVSGADLRAGSVKAGDLDPSLVRKASIGRAYAYVVPQFGPRGAQLAPKLDKTRTSGFSQVRFATDDGQPVVGIYCLKPSAGVDLSHSPILTSTDYSNSAGVGYRAIWAADANTGPYPTCVGNEVAVHTYLDAGNGPGQDPDEPSLDGRVAFQVFAP
ncbi:hypothetical protein ABFT23_07220 [Nocardioides sp. C4-1]|uniref:hypothetical protein n=1 Tax=Nocardioides sp. C4-1 TaxID=3151851 RepID=UPI00326689F8